MERVLQTLMIVDLYGTAPRYCIIIGQRHEFLVKDVTDWSSEIVQ